MHVLREKYEEAKAFKKNREYERYFLEKFHQRPLCIFGGGLLGRQICIWLIRNGIRPKCFCDNNPALHGKALFEDIRCVPFQELLKEKESIYVIVGLGDPDAARAVNLQLKDFKYVMRNPLGLSAYWCQTFDISGDVFTEGVHNVLAHVADEESRTLYRILTNLRLQTHVLDYPADILSRYYRKGQYIVRDIIDYNRIKTYVDCGAYNGDSLRDFINLGTHASYYCFEMDRLVFGELANCANEYRGENINLYPCGIGETVGKASYIPDDTGGSTISNCGTDTVQIVSLDSINWDKKIDFIKMDIEGAEESAIRGAKNLIKRDRPILAISIYHNFSQFVNVVRMIQDIEPQYQIYIRQHKCTMDDTVCYAVWKEL